MLMKASDADIPRLLPLLKEMHGSSPLRLPPLDLSRVEQTLRDCLSRGIIFITQDAKGILALRKCVFWYSNAEFLADQVFYVSIHHRKSRYASRLLRAAQDYATLVQLPLFLATSHGGDVERKNHFYQRSGMRLIGGIFERGL